MLSVQLSQTQPGATQAVLVIYYGEEHHHLYRAQEIPQDKGLDFIIFKNSLLEVW
jgi:hypothetical protein